MENNKGALGVVWKTMLTLTYVILPVAKKVYSQHINIMSHVYGYEGKRTSQIKECYLILEPNNFYFLFVLSKIIPNSCLCKRYVRSYLEIWNLPST